MHRVSIYLHRKLHRKQAATRREEGKGMNQKESRPAEDGAAANFVVYLDSRCRKTPKIHQVLRGKQFEQKRQKQHEFRIQALCAALASAERADKSGRCE